jgi:PAS domain S-box-containing protein
MPDATAASPLALPGPDALYRLLAENVTDYAIVVLDARGRVATWNEGAQRLLGHAEAQALGMPLAALYPAEDAEAGAPARDLERAEAQGRCDSLSWRVRADGTRIWATTVLTALRGDGAGTVGYGMILRDLTERKEAAEAYEESRQRYRSLFSHNPAAVFALDLDGAVRGANPAAAALTGADAEGADGFWSRFPAADAHRVRAAFDRAAAGEDAEAEAALTRVDGTPARAVLQLVPIRVDGAVRGVYAIAEDVTARRQAEAERELALLRERVARAEAEAANRAKSDFLAVVSHELRTPLHAITGFADLLADGDAGPLNDEQARWLGRIRTSGAHLLRMVEEVLGYVRMEEAEGGVALARVDLSALVREAAAAAADDAAARGLRLTVDAPAALAVQTDAGKVRQLLGHLASNAVKFTEAGEVRLVVRAEPRAAVVEVRDTGPGIAPEHLERIWEPFWQAEPPSTRRAGGTGLGLSVARRLAALLGGDLGVDSAPGRGTTFTLRLPTAGNA